MYGVIIFYNDGADLLRAALSSLRASCSRVIAIDGAYASFPHSSPQSAPETLEVAHEMADMVWTRTRPWASEVEKRNAYLSLVPDGEWTLMLDADEELVGPVDIPEDGGTEYRIELQRDDGIPPYPVFRLWKARTPLYYAGAHNALHDRDGLIDQKATPTLPGCHILHHYSGRPPARRADKAVYYRHLAEEEHRFRGANRHRM